MSAAPWTGRVGALIPSANAVFERDMTLALPPGVTGHIGRMKLTRDEPEQLAGLIDAAPRAADELADARVGAIAFACTTGSLDGGIGYDRKVIARIESATDGIPATSTSTALLQALEALGLGRVALVSPYEDWLDAKVVRFLDQNGVSVTAAGGFATPEPREIEAFEPDAIASACVAVDSAEADGVFVSCTGFRGLEAAALAATAIGKPVLSSNQATLWALLGLAGLPHSTPALGSLAEVEPVGRTPA